MPGIRIAITLDLCHSFGNFFNTRMLFVISFSHTVALGHRCLICLHSISYKSASLLFFRMLMPFISYSMVNGDVRECCVVWLCCCLPTPMALASGGSPMFPLVVHQPASPSIWPAVQSLRRGLSTNPGATMWCVCGCS